MRTRQLIILLLAPLLLLGALAVTAQAVTTGTLIDACYNKQNGQLRLRIGSAACSNSESPVSWPAQTGSAAPGTSGDIVPLLTLGNNSGANSISIAGGTEYPPALVQDGGVLIDPSMYPASTNIRILYYGELRPPTRVGGPIVTCFRLFDVTADSTVQGSEMCSTSPAWNGSDDPTIKFDVSSAPLALAPAAHRYIIQWKNSELGASGDIRSAEVVARW